MACVRDCEFCGKSTVNFDHEKCILDFVDNVHAQLRKHVVDHPQEPPPKELTEVFGSRKWTLYQDYLRRKDQSKDDDKKAKEYGAKIQAELQDEGRRRIKKLNNRFRVLVTVTCDLEPTY